MGLSASTGVTIRHPDRLFIGGEWVEPIDGGTIEIVSSDTEQVVGTVVSAGARDVERAIAAAREAFDEGAWPNTPPRERARLVRKLAEALERRTGDLAAAWTAQIGVLATAAPYGTAIGNANFFNAADLGDRFEFEEEVQSASAAAGIIVREPVGVVVAIAPWNGPYMLMSAKVAPALLAGCTVIMKPSTETPLEAYIIAECAEEVGLPKGALNLVPAGRDAADLLIQDSRIDKVTFTGSTSVGRRIASMCGNRLTRCTLELGGKSAAILLDDFPTDQAAKLLAGTITLMSGQVCAMLSRAIVPRRRHDELAQAIADEMRAIRVGYSNDPEAQMGPLASKRHLESVERYVEQGRAEGADLVTGGGRPAHLNSGYFIEPTLFANVDNSTTIGQEEIFGPVLSLIPCDDVDDAVRIANDSSFGLHGSVLSNDADAVYRIGRRIRTGSFAQSGLNVDFALPFGGFKQSGLGREGGAEGLMSYLETKAMLFNQKPRRTGA